MLGRADECTKGEAHRLIRAGKLQQLKDSYSVPKGAGVMRVRVVDVLSEVFEVDVPT